MKDGDFLIFITPQQFFCEKNTTCCITGHRKKDLPDGGDSNAVSMRRLLSMLSMLCSEAYGDGYRTFITGMAEGIDLMCAKLIYDMKVSEGKSDIRLVCALPYREQIRELKNAFDRYYYKIILDKCDSAVVVGSAGDKNRYRLRNQFMVDNSSRLIGAYKEKTTGSGTLQTINMAKRGGLNVQIISLDANRELFYGESVKIDGFKRFRE